jgi:RNA polymerase sigma-70 factor, ECF subfamily
MVRKGKGRALPCPARRATSGCFVGRMEETGANRRPTCMTQPSHVLVVHLPWMTVKEPDRQTIERCRRGDRDALRELFDAHGARVYSIARHFFGGDEARARDVTQDVFVKVMERIGQFEGASRLSTWLYRLTVNACLDERRSERRLVLLAESPDAMASPDGDPPQSTALETAETRDRVARAVSELTPPLRAVVLLRYFEGLSYDEIAEALECSPGTVASRLSRAHAALAPALSAVRNSEGAG